MFNELSVSHIKTRKFSLKIRTLTSNYAQKTRITKKIKKHKSLIVIVNQK